MKKEMLQNYAKLAIQKGVNLQKGQPVVISAELGQREFTHILTDAAYEAGAGDVVVFWRDEYIARQSYLKAEEKYFETFPSWMVERFRHYDELQAAYISLLSDNPEALKGVDTKRIQKYAKVSSQATKEHKNLIMDSSLRWNLLAMPSAAWAKKVFPDMSEADAIEALGNAIAKSARIDNNDPIAAWDAHDESFVKRAKFLNEKKFVSLHYQNSVGTDLVVELPEGHIWRGGSDVAKDGRSFFPNIPTEELFTMPKRTGVNGTLASTMPLVRSGNLIEGIKLTFQDGKVVKYSATANEPMLKDMIETDEGAAYLGEVALVPYDSPISNMNILFFNTLFDENASCHFALGEAYKNCMEGSEGLSEQELLQRGVNTSLIHVDFMVGSPDLRIVATDKDGGQTDIFVNGNFVI